MITSADNSKLKLVRKLRERKHREREGLFATEGEDLLEAGLAAGAEPKFVLVAPVEGGRSEAGPAAPNAGAPVRGAVGDPDAAGAGAIAADSAAPSPPHAEEVEPELLAAASTLGSGTRAIAVWALPHSSGVEPIAPCVYLHGVADPGNVGTIVRTADALLGGSVALGPECADPYSPKAVRASMGSIFARPPLRVELAETPAPRAALVAHGGAGLDSLTGAATLCLGAEREGLPEDVLGGCEVRATIPLRPGAAESLNVAAAAAIACAQVAGAAMTGTSAGARPAPSGAARISSPTMPGAGADA
jgi:TrmH family RNA methyltransferase